MAAKTFTVAEVAAHNTREDLYLIIRDEVYHVSDFVAEVSNLQSNYCLANQKFWKLTSISTYFLFVVASR